MSSTAAVPDCTPGDGGLILIRAERVAKFMNRIMTRWLIGVLHIAQEMDIRWGGEGGKLIERLV